LPVQDRSAENLTNGTTAFNILLTSCRDEIHRFWVEIRNSSQELSFSVANVLEAPEGTVVSWLLAGDEVHEQMNAVKKKANGDLMNSRSHHRIKYTAVSEDWVVGLEPNGAVIIWGIQNLTFSRNQKYPSVFIWNKLAPLPELDRNPTAIVSMGHSNLLEGLHSLDMVSLYVLTKKGRLSSWRCFLRPTLTHVNRVRTGAFWGHTSKICHLLSCYTSPLVCSIEGNGKAIVSELMRTAASDPSIVLSEITEIKDVASACWLAFDYGKNCAVLAVCSGSCSSELRFYKFSRKSSRSAFEYTLECTVDLKGKANLDLFLLSCHVSSENAETMTVVGVGGANGAAYFLKVSVDVLSRVEVICAESSKSFVSGCVTRPMFEEASLPHAVILGSRDGEVSFWDDAGAFVGSFVVDKEEKRPVETVACAYYGRFATRIAGSGQVNVWEMESSAPQVSLECSVSCSADDFVAFDWLSLHNGSHMLAIGSGKTVKLLLETGSKDLQSFSADWKTVELFSGLHSACASLSFSSDGTLIVGAMQELMVLTKWLSNETREQCTTLHKSNKLLRHLPLYHPKILAEYMMGGQMDIIKRILKNLLMFLCSDEKKQGWVPEPSLESIVGGAESMFAAAASKEKKEKQPAAGGGGDVLDMLNQKSLPSSAFDEQSSESEFSAADARKLSELLTNCSLARVSRKSQLHLLSIVDTFRQVLEAGPGLDESGTRFFIALKIFQFLKKTNSPCEFAISNWAWAMQSQAHDTLLSHAGSNLKFEDVRVLGIALWLKNPDKLKQVAEGLAKGQFLAKKDPFDCMLLYVALKRVTVLSKMFKVAKNEKIAAFLMNDFSEERWQTAALKNAYALLKQQRFNQAAAFFLVAGKLRDCVKILLKHEKDYMLAMIVARLWEGSITGENVKWILTSHILPLAESRGDKWLESIAFWLLGDFVGSFHALLHTDESKSVVPFSLASNSSDFNPVVMYYIEHLLSSTELVKHKKMDSKTFNVLRRKTIYSTFNAGCVHHCLDQLINVAERITELGEAEAETKKKVTAAPKPAAPAVDPMMSMAFAFDDGFGDMPTPAWAMKKEEKEESSSAGGGSSDAGDATGSDGNGEAGVDKELYEKSLQNISEMDALVKIKVAIMYISGLFPKYAEQCASKAVDWNLIRRDLFENIAFVSKKLSCDEAQILELLKTYCEVYHRCFVHYLLLDSEESRTAFFVQYSWEISSAITNSLHTYYPLPKTQASEMAGVSKELELCYRQCLAGRSDAMEMEERFLMSISLGLFFSAWVNSDYQAFHDLLFDTIYAAAEAPASTLFEEEGDDESTDGQIEQFLLEMMNLMVLDFFIRRIVALLVGRAESMGMMLEILTQKYKSDSVEVKAVEALRRYEIDLLELLGAQADYVLPQLRKSNDLGSESMSQMEVWRPLFHKMRKYRNDDVFVRVCDEIVTNSALEKLLRDSGLEKKINCRQHLLPQRAKRTATFQPPQVLVEDGDLLQNFIIGNGENAALVLATSKGQAELAVDSIATSARRFSQHHLLTKSKSIHDVLRASPERHSSITSMNAGNKSPNKGPPIPQSAFLNQEDVATCLVAHPHLPFYLSATVSGSICLHQFGFPELLTPYRKAGPRIHSMKFASSGSRFGAVDDNGVLSLWQFESNSESQNAFATIPCFSKRANDLCFLDTNNIVATAGLSKKQHHNFYNVKVWDTLIAPEKACVVSFNAHPKGATSLMYSESSRLLFSGGKTGEVCIWDMRMDKLLQKVNAHTLNVRTMALDETGTFLATGSSDGNVKVWNILDMSEPVQMFQDAHKQQTFTKNQSKFLSSAISTFGVMHVGFCKQKLYTCGSDGRLVSRVFRIE
jgi:WD40 repeat protein